MLYNSMNQSLEDTFACRQVISDIANQRNIPQRLRDSGPFGIGDGDFKSIITNPLYPRSTHGVSLIQNACSSHL